MELVGDLAVDQLQSWNPFWRESVYTARELPAGGAKVDVSN